MALSTKSLNNLFFSICLLFTLYRRCEPGLAIRGIDTTHYLSNENVGSFLQSLSSKFPSLAKVDSLGLSGKGKDIWRIQISDNVTKNEPGEPRVKIVGNIVGNEATGRQMLIYLAEYLLEHYDTGETKAIVDSIKISLIVSINPDGFEVAEESDCQGMKGSGNGNSVDLMSSFLLASSNANLQPESEVSCSYYILMFFIMYLSY